MNIKFKIVIIVFLSMLSIKMFSQQTIEIVRPKGKWYFGAEIGTNEILSFSTSKLKKTFQGSVFAEYYFAKQWSVSGKIKYFETGVSFNKSGSSGWFASEGAYGIFRGAVIAVPVFAKWEFRIYKNLKGNIKSGFSYNVEVKSNYSDYSSNLSPSDYSKNYLGYNGGYGLNYFVNKKLAVFIDVEYYLGGTKGESNSFFGKEYYNTQNSLVNFGIKYNFKKEKK